MNVVIVEDEPLTAQWLETLLHEYDPEIQVLAQLGSVAKSVEWFTTAQPQQPDLVFLDVHLEDDLGFALIEQAQLTTPVVFTTADDTYVHQAFKVNSIDYLLKPIDLNDLTATLTKYKSFRQKMLELSVEHNVIDQLVKRWGTPAYRDRFMVSVGSRLRSIRTDETAYFYFEDKTTYLMPQAGFPIPIDYSLDKLSQLVDPSQFFRINRSFLVSISAINQVQTSAGSKLKVDLTPPSRQDTFVSVDRVTEFKNWLGR